MIAGIFKKIILKLRGEVSTSQLIKSGLVVGYNFNRLYGCKIDSTHCWLISIGDNVTLAPGVHILAHDASTRKDLGYTKIGLVTIGSDVFIGAGSIILPGVTIGDNVIIGAGSVVTKNIPANSVVAGNPASFICTASEYIAKNSSLLKKRPQFDKSWTVENGITMEQKKIMREKLSDGTGFVE